MVIIKNGNKKIFSGIKRVRSNEKAKKAEMKRKKINLDNADMCFVASRLETLFLLFFLPFCVRLALLFRFSLSLVFLCCFLKFFALDSFFAPFRINFGFFWCVNFLLEVFWTLFLFLKCFLFYFLVKIKKLF